MFHPVVLMPFTKAGLDYERLYKEPVWPCLATFAVSFSTNKVGFLFAGKEKTYFLSRYSRTFLRK